MREKCNNGTIIIKKKLNKNQNKSRNCETIFIEKLRKEIRRVIDNHGYLYVAN